MLDFWYSDKCHRQIKLFICIATCLLIYVTAKVSALSTSFILASLALGVSIHLLKLWEDKLKAQQRYTTYLDIIFFIFPILVWIFMMFNLPKQHTWALMLQVLSFSALGLFVISLYSTRAQR